MADAHRQIPGGAYHNDIDETTLYQRMIPTFGISKYVNDVQLSTAAVTVQTFLMFPVRFDAMGHGGIFPGNRVE